MPGNERVARIVGDLATRLHLSAEELQRMPAGKAAELLAALGALANLGPHLMRFLRGRYSAFPFGQALLACLEDAKVRGSNQRKEKDGGKNETSTSGEKIKIDHPRREERLTSEQNDQQAIVSLKNGETMESQLAWDYLDSLRLLLEEHPKHFLALLAAARGNERLPRGNIAQLLRRHRYLRNDRSIDPDYRNVLLSSYQETPEGPVLANPFAPGDQYEADQLTKTREADDAKWRRIISDIANDDLSR